MSILEVFGELVIVMVFITLVIPVCFVLSLKVATWLSDKLGIY